MYCTPGPDSSNLINTEKAVPNNPENNAKIKYNVPISLALDDKNHLSVQREIPEFNLFIFDSTLFIITLPFKLSLFSKKTLDCIGYSEGECVIIKYYIFNA